MALLPGHQQQFDTITYQSFSGTDIVATVVLPNETLILGELQTLSYSIHRENTPVRLLGHTNVSGFVKGGRCLPASTKVFIKDKGLISIADVQVGDYVQSTGSEFNKVLGSFDQGSKHCLELRLANGYKIIGSYDHPISTSEGWKKLGDISLSDKVDVVAKSPSHDEDYDIDDDILRIIGLLIGGGGIHTYTKSGGSIEHRLVLTIALAEIETIGKESERILNGYNIPYRDTNIKDGSFDRVISVCINNLAKTDWRLRKYNILHEWILKLNMYGTYSHTKFIPQEFLAHLSRRQIIIFLRYLFSADGCYCISNSLIEIAAQYCSTSEELIDGIRLLLSKMGIPAIKSLRKKEGAVGGRPDIVSRYDSFELVISNAKDLLKFINRIGIFGKDSRIIQFIPLLRRRMRSDYIGISAKDFFGLAREIIARDGLDRMAIKRTHQIYNYGLNITPYRALHLAEDLGDEEFSDSMNSLIDELLDKDEEFTQFNPVSIVDIGELQVYDLEVEDRHSFIADFIKVHNTIAGSMIFVNFNTYAFYRLAQLRTYVAQPGNTIYPLADMLPPFDVSVTFVNEQGLASQMKILGLSFIDEGGTMSVDDLMFETSMTYMARGIEPMTPMDLNYIPINGRFASPPTMGP